MDLPDISLDCHLKPFFVVLNFVQHSTYPHDLRSVGGATFLDTNLTEALGSKQFSNIG